MYRNTDYATISVVFSNEFETMSTTITTVKIIPKIITICLIIITTICLATLNTPIPDKMSQEPMK